MCEKCDQRLKEMQAQGQSADKLALLREGRIVARVDANGTPHVDPQATQDDVLGALASITEMSVAVSARMQEAHAQMTYILLLTGALSEAHHDRTRRASTQSEEPVLFTQAAPAAKQ